MRRRHPRPPLHFNPRSPCGERPPTNTGSLPFSNFNPRSPCGERPDRITRVNLALKFQSTLSLRRATYLDDFVVVGRKDFNPRSPCGERQHDEGRSHKGIEISIHALLAESDAALRREDTDAREFQSTLSLRRATDEFLMVCWDFVISIHALLAESDHHCGNPQPQVGRISIHALLAESDRHSNAWYGASAEFQSTLSLRRATGSS